MQFQPLGSTGIEVSKIIMGTWQAGKAMWTGIDDAQTVRAIQAGIEAGITAIDTAPVYGKGHSERIVAKAVGGMRSRLVIATKVFADQMSRDGVRASCEKSLKDLNTDYIDLLQIHWPSGSFNTKKVPIEETMGALVALKDEGKIRAIGVSNFTREELIEAAACGDIVSLQPPYSLFWRHIEKSALPYCSDNGIAVLAYSPMAQGLLTGKFGPDHRFLKGDHRRGNRLFQPGLFERALAALDQLRPIADRYGATLGQLALAWVVHQPNACAIAGARDADQSVQNAEAGRIKLSQEDIEIMGKIGRTVTDHLDEDPMLWRW
jgi:aryl-alcohol dehydrogenase-like predicted oxidoreductase